MAYDWLGSQMCGNPMDLFTLLKTTHDSTNLFIESDTNELTHPKGMHQQRWDVSLECWCIAIRMYTRVYNYSSCYNLLDTI